ncbi:hypothetical protein J3R30DRAFT_1336722 [Lentinula aciculospora]|uniref:Uncharacterized protein n=1 Tax=Lentinula aciculospora TaxID=153920 RepID=A0A9W9DUC2_9AGAR|nr:hypothetical protein J3R30DRAFT_1336722 [Lentinula aciculospora]
MLLYRHGIRFSYTARILLFLGIAAFLLESSECASRRSTLLSSRATTDDKCSCEGTTFVSDSNVKKAEKTIQLFFDHKSVQAFLPGPECRLRLSPRLKPSSHVFFAAIRYTFAMRCTKGSSAPVQYLGQNVYSGLRAGDSVDGILYITEGEPGTKKQLLMLKGGQSKVQHITLQRHLHSFVVVLMHGSDPGTSSTFPMFPLVLSSYAECI